jgi:hypothetical protein
MSEMILPGTYVTIRDEGLITAGRVVTGNIGIVGTASSEATSKCIILSSFTEAQATFVNEMDDSKKEYTLMNALKMIFNNGGQTVYAVQAKSDSLSDYETALALLENELVNIVLLAGQDAATEGMLTALKAHIDKTALIKRERIGIIGCSIDSVDGSAATHDSGRLIYVGPGVYVPTKTDAGAVVSSAKSGAYTAAAVAGLLSSLPVQTSPTNKTLNIERLATNYSSSELKALIGKSVLAVENRNGFRIVKGITTSTNSAWHQITTRRIVDYATYGVRSACDPYIGKLNNDRVRGAMKATIDGFLTRMVEDEALTGYTLEVSATRPQEIAGEVRVTMTIQPTFSIDFIVVTMYLG